MKGKTRLTCADGGEILYGHRTGMQSKNVSGYQYVLSFQCKTINKNITMKGKNKIDLC